MPRGKQGGVKKKGQRKQQTDAEQQTCELRSFEVWKRWQMIIHVILSLQGIFCPVFRVSNGADLSIYQSISFYIYISTYIYTHMCVCVYTVLQPPDEHLLLV